MTTVSAGNTTGVERRRGDEYVVVPEELERFRRDGYVHLRGVMSESEMKVIDDAYEAFLQRQIHVEGRDFNDMTTGEFGTDPTSYAIVNVMLPRKYLPSLQGNLFERRAASIARQLCGDGMVIDFDQLLAKQPFRDDAVFAWHQDQAYWIDTPDRRTATCWLAVDDST
ncbi:MAG: phytanoyl-CoA dioxygenase family protein, partial [Actinomycetota bacterium]